MAAKSLKEKGDGIIAAICILSYFVFGALMLQGALLLLLGSICFCGIICICFGVYNRRYNTDESPKNDGRVEITCGC